MTALTEKQADATCARLTKELFLLSLECPARGWRLRRSRHEEPPTPGDLARMLEGQSVHRRARALFPDGVFAAVKGDSAGRTRQLLENSTKRVFFEAAFVVGPLSARVDILIREDDGWHLIEVKSNVNMEDDLVQDLAFSTMVLRRAGVRVVKASLLLISPDFRLGMANERLFRSVDCTTDAFAWADQFDRIADELDKVTSAPECPSSPLTRTCRSCPFYKVDCHGAGINHDILELPRITNWRLKTLTDSKIMRIADIPADPRLLTPTQAIVRRAVISGHPIMDRARLKAVLAKVRYPACYLDFEALSTGIPLYPDLAPYEVVTSQYSAHYCDRLGHICDHREFLADHRRDCRRDLAQQLCDDLDKARSIIVYTSYEAITMRALGRLYPDLRERLDGHIDRLLDLEQALRPGAYYHPEFKGRSSLKVTLPVLVPDFGYDGLNIADGDCATAMFARMAKGECSPEEGEKIRRDLLLYCATDTLAMIRLHIALCSLLESTPAAYA